MSKYLSGFRWGISEVQDSSYLFEQLDMDLLGLEWKTRLSRQVFQVNVFQKGFKQVTIQKNHFQTQYETHLSSKQLELFHVSFKCQLYEIHFMSKQQIFAFPFFFNIFFFKQKQNIFNLGTTSISRFSRATRRVRLALGRRCRPWSQWGEDGGCFWWLHTFFFSPPWWLYTLYTTFFFWLYCF